MTSCRLITVLVALQCCQTFLSSEVNQDDGESNFFEDNLFSSEGYFTRHLIAEGEEVFLRDTLLTPVVKTSSGVIRGEFFQLIDGSRGAKYLGIPYAKPPTGVRRFRVSYNIFI